MSQWGWVGLPAMCEPAYKKVVYEYVVSIEYSLKFYFVGKKCSFLYFGIYIFFHSYIKTMVTIQKIYSKAIDNWFVGFN